MAFARCNHCTALDAGKQRAATHSRRPSGDAWAGRARPGSVQGGSGRLAAALEGCRRGVVHTVAIPTDHRREPACHSSMLFPRILRRSHATTTVYVAAKTPPPPRLLFHASAALRAIDMAKVDTSHRLAELRKLMKERNVDIYSKPARAWRLHTHRERERDRESHVADPAQWCPLKTAIKASTLPRVTPAEVRTPRCSSHRTH